MKETVHQGKGEPWERKMKMLKEYLDRQAVCICEASDWQQAIEQSASGLLRMGRIEPSYLQRALENVRELGPYIVLARGIAVAHARPGADVQASSVGIAGLTQPVPFGHKQYDPVQVVLMMAAPDDVSHVRLMMEIAQKLSQPEVIQALEKADSMEKLYEAMVWGEE